MVAQITKLIRKKLFVALNGIATGIKRVTPSPPLWYSMPIELIEIIKSESDYLDTLQGST